MRIISGKVQWRTPQKKKSFLVTQSMLGTEKHLKEVLGSKREKIYKKEKINLPGTTVP